MKFSPTHWLFAATFMAASATSSAAAYDWTVTSGQAALAFSPNGLDAVSGIGAVILTQPTVPYVRGLPDGGQTNTANYIKQIATLNLALSSGAVAGDALTTVSSTQAFIEFRRSTLDEYDQVHNQSVLLSNLDINVSASTVYANVYTLDRSAPVNGFAQAISFGKLAVFSFAKAGPIGGAEGNIIVDAVSAAGVATGHASMASTDSLRLNAGVADLFLSGLGLDPASRDEFSQQIRLRSWGTLSVNANVSGIVAVPEPSTWLLMGMGLLMLPVARRFGRQPV